VPVTLGAIAISKEPLRYDQIQIILGARHGNIQQAPLFLDLGRRAGTHFGWQPAIT
jgi:hypothetical protein